MSHRREKENKNMGMMRMILMIAVKMMVIVKMVRMMMIVVKVKMMVVAVMMKMASAIVIVVLVSVVMMKMVVSHGSSFLVPFSRTLVDREFANLAPSLPACHVTSRSLHWSAHPSISRVISSPE